MYSPSFSFSAINLELGNTNAYVIDVNSSSTNFVVAVGDDDSLVFNSMMHKLEELFTWAGETENKSLHFVDVEFEGISNGFAEFSITKIYGDIDEVSSAVIYPTQLTQGARRSINNGTCYQYTETRSAKDEISNRINQVLRAGEYRRAFWTNIKLGLEVGYSSYCTCGSCAQWGPCNKLWSGYSEDECIVYADINHYMNRAWEKIDNTNFLQPWKKYRYLCSWIGDQAYYPDPTHSHINILRIGQLHSLPLAQ